VGLKLDAGEIVELAWWWDEPPQGRLLELREVSIVRSLLSRWCKRPGQVASLRWFVARQQAWDFSQIENSDLFDQIAVAIVRGRIRVGVASRETLLAWDGKDEAQPEESVTRAQKPDVVIPENDCWPCKQARKAMDEAARNALAGAVSAGALRHAAKNGAPFVVDW